MFLIQMIAKTLLTIAPAHQVMNCPVVLNSQLARQRQLLIEGQFVSIVRTDPYFHLRASDLLSRRGE